MEIPGWGVCEFINFPGYVVEVIPAGNIARRSPPTYNKKIVSSHEMDLLSDPIYSMFELLKSESPKSS